MKNWQGMDLGSSDVGEGFLLVQNVSFDKTGECQQRPGLGAKQALTGIICDELPPVTIFVQADWTLKTVPQTGTTITTLTGNLGTAGTDRPTMAAAFGRMYFAGSTTASMVCYDPVNSGVRNIGITAPTGTPSAVVASGAGGCSAGKHLIRYRYYDSTRNRLSNPTDAAEVEIQEERTAQITATLGGGGSLSGIIVTDSGSGYTSVPAITFDAATAGVQAVASATLSGSTVASIAVTTTGAGYTTAPLVTVAASPTADNAVAIAAILPSSPFGVGAIYVLDGGSGYTASPTVTLSAPPAGVTAVASAVVVSGKLTGARITNPGAGYSYVPAATVAAPVAKKRIALPVTASGDSSVNYIRVEMTAADSSTFYLVGDYTNASTTLDIGITDAQLIQNEPAITYGEWSHNSPAAAALIVEHKNRLWTWKQASGRSELLAWSQDGYPESFDTTSNARFVTLDAGDTPSAMASYYSDLYLFGQRSMKRLAYTDDPGGGMLVPIPGQFGAFNQRCVIKIQGGVMFGWGREGVWAISAMVPRKVSGAVDDYLATYGDSTRIDERFIAFDPVDNTLLFFFCLSGETTCRAALVYHLANEQWTINRYRQGIYAGCTNSDYTDVTRLLLADANGYSWRVGVSTNDGGEAGEVTVGAGSTDTIINCTNSAQVGQMAYFPATGEERLISACDAASITLSVALAATPSTGALVSIGSFPVRFKTKWFSGSGMPYKKRPVYLTLEQNPEGTDVGTATVAYHQDFATGNVTITSVSADTPPDGITLGTSNITVDFDEGADDGYIPVPMPSDWKRVVQAEVSRDYAGANPLRLLDMRFAMDKADEALVESE